MMRLERPAPPATFAANAGRWTRQHREACSRNPAHQLVWYRVNGITARDLALPALRMMTDEHCAYCDSWPSYDVGETIDHFRPKSAHPELVYEWTNLFLACVNCQKRGNRFDELLLKPDDSQYTFERYFEYSAVTGRLSPASAASDEESRRAELTIELFDLNHPERCKSRMRLGGTDDGPYRFVRAP